MLNSFLLLSQIDVPELEAIKNARKTSPKIFGTDVTVVLGVALLLALGLFCWAFFFRKRPKQARGALVLERASRDSEDSHGSSGRRRRRKRRPDHPDNWGRNPTLSETGGLPPERRDDGDTSSDSQSPPAR